MMTLNAEQREKVCAGMDHAAAAFREHWQEPGPGGKDDLLQAYETGGSYRFTDMPTVRVTVRVEWQQDGDNR